MSLKIAIIKHRVLGLSLNLMKMMMKKIELTCDSYYLNTFLHFINTPIYLTLSNCIYNLFMLYQIKQKPNYKYWGFE